MDRQYALFLPLLSSMLHLAGSERQDETMAERLTFEEGKLIDKSLSALGNVANALANKMDMTW